MMRIIITATLILVLQQVHAQIDHFSTTSGSWGDTLVWNTLTSFPDTLDDAFILWVHTIAVTSAEACDDLTVAGTLNISDGGSMYVAGDFVSDYGSTINIDSGSIVINGGFKYNGEVNIHPASGNYLEFRGQLSSGGNTRWNVIEGGVRIYSSLKFGEEEVEPE